MDLVILGQFGKKIKTIKLLKITKILNYVKFLFINFCARMYKYSLSLSIYIYIYYSQKELKHFGLEVLVVYGVLEHFELF